MSEQFSRTARLIGAANIEKLAHSHVCLFGVGGVGGYVAEALARSGVGYIDLVDHDQICLSNINRQIIATHRTLGRDKVDVMRERILDINPDAQVTVHKCFYLPETQNQFDFSQYDYVIDAIDTVAGKIALVCQAAKVHTPIISCMGAGNKLDPAAFQVADIYRTSVCPLAKVMRRELKKYGIKKLKVVYSRETPIAPQTEEESSELALCEKNTATGIETGCENSLRAVRRAVPGSVAFVPSVAGLIIAGEVVRDLINLKIDQKDLKASI